MAYDPAVAYKTDSMVALVTSSARTSVPSSGTRGGPYCSADKVQLPSFESQGSLPVHIHFMDGVQIYNGCFIMTSFGAK